MKEYMARTSMSLSVQTPSGRTRYVAFKVQTDGRSVFRTDDEDLQKGLESHYKFGRTFVEVEAERPMTVTEAVIEFAPTTQESGLTRVTVSDIADAREQIARKTGISRSKLRKREEILEAAKKNNIMIVGLD